MNLPIIPADKANHFVYGACIFTAVYACAVLAGLPHAVFIASAIAFAAALLKEAFDWLSNKRAISSGLKPTHSVDFMDAVATIYGALVCLVCVEIG